jgi:hypothetical protein
LWNSNGKFQGLLWKNHEKKRIYIQNTFHNCNEICQKFDGINRSEVSLVIEFSKNFNQILMKVLYILYLKNNYHRHFKVFWEKETCLRVFLAVNLPQLIIIDKGLIAFQSKFEFSNGFSTLN